MPAGYGKSHPLNQQQEQQLEPVRMLQKSSDHYDIVLAASKMS
jgi:hypothetical protein